MHGLPHVLAVGLIVTQLSGCSLLDLLLGLPPDPFDPDEPFPIPTAEAAYATGTATLTIDGETIVLDELVGEGRIDDVVGLTVRWTNGTGWYLGVESFDMGGFGESAYVSLDWIAENRHWTVFNTYECEATIERANASGVKGAATCRGLEWTDVFDTMTMSGPPSPIPGMQPFDAEITFEAH